MFETNKEKTAVESNVQRQLIEISSVSIWVRAAWLLSALILVLLVSTLKSGAEEVSPNTTQLGKSGQHVSDAEAQEPADTTKLPKNRCRPKKPCPDTEGDQP